MSSRGSRQRDGIRLKNPARYAIFPVKAGKVGFGTSACSSDNTVPEAVSTAMSSGTESAPLAEALIWKFGSRCVPRASAVFMTGPWMPFGQGAGL